MMLAAAIVSSLATMSRSTLLVHGRGMACAIWDTGGKAAKDCIYHKAPGARYPVSLLRHHPGELIVHCEMHTQRMLHRVHGSAR